MTAQHRVLRRAWASSEAEIDYRSKGQLMSINSGDGLARQGHQLNCRTVIDWTRFGHYISLGSESLNPAFHSARAMSSAVGSTHSSAFDQSAACRHSCMITSRSRLGSRFRREGSLICFFFFVGGSHSPSHPGVDANTISHRLPLTVTSICHLFTFSARARRCNFR